LSVVRHRVKKYLVKGLTHCRTRAKSATPVPTAKNEFAAEEPLRAEV
jgi:hypothetical protein